MIEFAQASKGNGGIKKYIGQEFGQTFGQLYSMPSTLGVSNIYNPDNISLNTYSEMAEDAQIQACLTVIKMPVIKVGWTIKCEESDDIQKFVQDALKAIWISLVRDMLTAIEFGFSALTKRFDYNENRQVIWKKFLALDPRTVTINLDRNSFAGITQNNIHIPGDMCLLFVPEQRFGNLYGRSRLKAAYNPWFASKYISQFANRYFEQFASPQKVIRHPEGQTQTGTDGSGTPTYRANYLIAQDIGNSLQNAATITMPASQWMDGKEVPTWAIELLEAKRGGAADYQDYMNHLDVMMARAMFVPDLTFSQGNNVTGSNAMAMTHADIFLQSEEALLDLLKGTIDAYVIPQIVEVNFGTSAPRATWEYEGLTNETRAMLTNIMLEMVKGDRLRPDPEWIAEQFGVKLSKEEPEEKATTAPVVQPEEEEEETAEEAQAEKGFFAHVADYFKKKSVSCESSFWRPLTPAEEKSGINFARLAEKMTSAETRIRGKMEKVLLDETRKYVKQARKLITQGISWGDLLKKLEGLNLEIPEYRKMLEDEIKALWNEAREIFAKSYKIAHQEWPEEVAKAIEDKAEFIARTHTYKVKDEMLKAAETGYSYGLSSYAMEEKLKTAADQWIKTGPDLKATAQVTVTENINLAFQTQAELSQEFKAVELSAILDSTTCGYCRAVDGTTFKIMDKGLPGMRPPFHFNCRCLWIYIGKDDTGSSEPTGAPSIPSGEEEKRTFFPGENYIPQWLDEAMKGASGKRKKEAVAVYNASVRAAGANRKLMDELRKRMK